MYRTLVPHSQVPLAEAIIEAFQSEGLDMRRFSGWFVYKHDSKIDYEILVRQKPESRLYN